MHPCLVSSSKAAIPLHAIKKENLTAWLEQQDKTVSGFLKAVDFKAQAGKLVMIPGDDGGISMAVFGIGEGDDALALAGASANLPKGDYELATHPECLSLEQVVLGWCDGAYQFGRYKKANKPPRLVVKDRKQARRLGDMAAGIDLARDLINTPAQDMGPSELAEATADLAVTFDAKPTVIVGDALLNENYPMVHAVGRAAKDQPRYVEFEWGDEDAPRIALVGKGVAFDTGGLNIKTGNYMRLMKKDMGGAAHVLALAHMIMSARLNVRLSVHIPTAENAVGAGAFRPGDILDTRKGLTVEIDNTDAEGRLLLGDALTRASELKPEVLIDFATLTGAARVAMGAEIVPFMTNSDQLAQDLMTGSDASGDPAWRLPLWHRYNAMLKSSIADVSNGAASPFAGTITAALFLERFVNAPQWVHFDTWGWRNAQYGRPAGGAVMGVRAVFNMLERRFGN